MINVTLTSNPTPRQQQVLDAIKSYQREHGYGPTIRELMDALDIGTPNGVMCHLRALKAKGLIDWQENKARSIRVLNAERCPTCGGVRHAEVVG